MHMKSFLLTVLMCTLLLPAFAQQRPRTFESFGSNLWVGTYNQFRLSEKLFWRAEMHYRRGGYNDVPFVGRMAQIYNRHALNYLVSPVFNVSLGGVVRLNFTSDPGNEALDPLLHEPRIWHEYLFVMPFPRFQLYHRIRIEHRWSKSNALGSEWLYRDRWRYKFFMKIPLNSTRLAPGTFYFNPDVEIIMQSGKPVIDSPLEDLRIYPSFAYISSPRVTYSAGLMYTTGQRLFDGSVYRQRWVIRVNAYVSLDLRKEKKKVPKIKLSD